MPMLIGLFLAIPVFIILAFLAWLGLLAAAHLLARIARKGIAPHLGLVAIAVAGALGFAGYVCDVGLGGLRPNPVAGLIFAIIAVPTALIGLAILLGGGVAVPTSEADARPQGSFWARHWLALVVCVILGLVGGLGTLTVGHAASAPRQRFNAVKEEEEVKFRIMRLRQSLPSGTRIEAEAAGDHWTVFTVDDRGQRTVVETIPRQAQSGEPVPALTLPAPPEPAEVEPPRPMTPAAGHVFGTAHEQMQARSEEEMVRMRIVRLNEGLPTGTRIEAEAAGDHWTLFTVDAAGQRTVVETIPRQALSGEPAPTLAPPTITVPAEVEPPRPVTPDAAGQPASPAP
jgi:hypothetical protein